MLNKAAFIDQKYSKNSNIVDNRRIKSSHTLFPCFVSRFNLKYATIKRHNFRFLILSCINGSLRHIHDYKIATTISLTYDHHIYISTLIKKLSPGVLVNGYCIAVTVCPLNTVIHYGLFETKSILKLGLLL